MTHCRQYNVCLLTISFICLFYSAPLPAQNSSTMTAAETDTTGRKAPSYDRAWWLQAGLGGAYRYSIHGEAGFHYRIRNRMISIGTDTAFQWMFGWSHISYWFLYSISTNSRNAAASAGIGLSMIEYTFNDEYNPEWENTVPGLILRLQAILHPLHVLGLGISAAVNLNAVKPLRSFDIVLCIGNMGL